MFDPESYLNSLEPIGWRLGLERMELLSEELGRPQDGFESIHVVGTNGKSSVARMSAALIEAHGVKSGCLLSPHISHWSERVLVGGVELPDTDFIAAVERTALAADRVNGSLFQGEVVTQFEVATAAAFLAMAEAGVETAVIEAGLGGRLDATNSIPSKVTVLVSIGLDHTEWLGETELEIAAEKVAVLRPGTTLVIGDLSPEVERLTLDRARELGCGVKRLGDDVEAFDLRIPAKYQRGNFRVAMLAVESILGELEQGKIEAVAASIVIPGRLEKVNDEPEVYVDVAHNRPGAAALAGSVPGVADGRPVMAVIGMLSSKDAPGMLAELACVIDTAILTEPPENALRDSGRPGARAFPVAELEAFATELGIKWVTEPDPRLALSRATSEAVRKGGMVLVAGSHFLLSGLEVD